MGRRVSRLEPVAQMPLAAYKPQPYIFSFEYRLSSHGSARVGDREWGVAVEVS